MAKFRRHHFFWLLCCLPVIHILLLLILGLEHPISPLVQLFRPIGTALSALFLGWAVITAKGSQRLPWSFQVLSMLCAALFSALKITTGASTEQLPMRILWLLIYGLSIIATALYLRVQSFKVGTTLRVLSSGVTVGFATFAILRSTLPELYPLWAWNERINLFVPTLSFDFGILFTFLVVSLRYEMKTTPLVPLAFLSMLCLLIADSISAFIAWSPWNSLYQGDNFIVYPLFTLQSIILSYGAYCDLNHRKNQNQPQNTTTPYREWFLWSLLPQIFVLTSLFTTSQFSETPPLIIVSVIIVALLHTILADQDYRRVYQNFQYAQEEIFTTNNALTETNVRLVETQQRLEQALLNAEDLAAERERARVASEIHDGLGGHLSTLKVHLEIAASTVEEDPARAAAAFAVAEEEAAAAQRELRRAVEALNAGSIAQPLDVLLAALARATEHTGLHATLAIHGVVRPLAQPVQHALYRIAQEALHNAQRHASATLVAIELDFRVAGEVQLRISDNGVGLPASDAAQPQGHGLRNMYNRVLPLGGTLEITSQPYQGVSLWVTLPLTER